MIKFLQRRNSKFTVAIFLIFAVVSGVIANFNLLPLSRENVKPVYSQEVTILDKDNKTQHSTNYYPFLLTSDNKTNGISIKPSEIQELLGNVRILEKSEVPSSVKIGKVGAVSDIKDAPIADLTENPLANQASAPLAFYQVVGTSMEPTLHTGDYIQIQSEGFNDGDIVIAKLKNGGYVVKRYQENMLLSDNKETGATFSLEEASVIGKGIAISKDVAGDNKWAVALAASSYPAVGTVQKITEPPLGAYLIDPFSANAGFQIIDQRYTQVTLAGNFYIQPKAISGTGTPIQNYSSLIALYSRSMSSYMKAVSTCMLYGGDNITDQPGAIYSRAPSTRFVYTNHQTWVDRNPPYNGTYSSDTGAVNAAIVAKTLPYISMINTTEVIYLGNSKYMLNSAVTYSPTVSLLKDKTFASMCDNSYQLYFQKKNGVRLYSNSEVSGGVSCSGTMGAQLTVDPDSYIGFAGYNAYSPTGFYAASLGQLGFSGSVKYWSSDSSNYMYTVPAYSGPTVASGYGTSVTGSHYLQINDPVVHYRSAGGDFVYSPHFGAIPSRWDVMDLSSATYDNYKMITIPGSYYEMFYDDTIIPVVPSVPSITSISGGYNNGTMWYGNLAPKNTITVNGTYSHSNTSTNFNVKLILRSSDGNQRATVIVPITNNGTANRTFSASITVPSTWNYGTTGSIVAQGIVASTGNSSAESLAFNNFRIDAVAPSISTPVVQEVKGTSMTVTTSGSDFDSGLPATPYQFSINGGSTWSAAQASPTYTFTGLTKDTSYTPQIKITDNVGLTTTKSAVATKTLADPTVTISTPTSSSIFSNVTGYNIIPFSGTILSRNTGKSIELSYKLGSGAKTVFNTVAATGFNQNVSANIPIPIGTPSGSTLLTIYANDVDCGEGSASVSFTIDTTGPTVTFSPNGSSTYAKSQSVTVTASDPSGVASTSYAWSNSSTKPDDAKFTDFTGALNSPIGINGNYYLFIKATDSVGNVSVTTSNTYAIDSAPPVFSVNTGDKITSEIMSKTKYVALVEIKDVASGVDLTSVYESSFGTAKLLSSTPSDLSTLDYGIYYTPNPDNHTIKVLIVGDPDGEETVSLNLQARDIAGNLGVSQFTVLAIARDPVTTITVNSSPVTFISGKDSDGSTLYSSFAQMTSAISNVNVTLENRTPSSASYVISYMNKERVVTDLTSRTVGANSSISINVPYNSTWGKSFTLVISTIDSNNNVTMKEYWDVHAIPDTVLKLTTEPSITIAKGDVLSSTSEQYKYTSEVHGSAAHFDDPILPNSGAYKINSDSPVQLAYSRPVYKTDSNVKVYYDGFTMRDIVADKQVSVSDMSSLTQSLLSGANSGSIKAGDSVSCSASIGNSSRISTLISNITKESTMLSVIVKNTTEEVAFSPYVSVIKNGVVSNFSKTVPWDSLSAYSIHYFVVAKNEYSGADWNTLTQKYSGDTLVSKLTAGVKTDHPNSTIDLVLSKSDVSANSVLANGLIKTSGDYIVVVYAKDILGNKYYSKNHLNVVMQGDKQTIPITNSAQYQINSNFLVNLSDNSSVGFGVEAYNGTSFVARGVLSDIGIVMYSIGSEMFEVYDTFLNLVKVESLPNKITCVSQSTLGTFASTDNGIYNLETKNKISASENLNLVGVAVSDSEIFAISNNTLYRFYNSLTEIESRTKDASIVGDYREVYLNGTDIVVVTTSGEVIIFH